MPSVVKLAESVVDFVSASEPYGSALRGPGRVEQRGGERTRLVREQDRVPSGRVDRDEARGGVVGCVPVADDDRPAREACVDDGVFFLSLIHI